MATENQARDKESKVDKVAQAVKRSTTVPMRERANRQRPGAADPQINAESEKKERPNGVSQ